MHHSSPQSGLKTTSHAQPIQHCAQPDHLKGTGSWLSRSSAIITILFFTIHRAFVFVFEATPTFFTL